MKKTFKPLLTAFLLLAPIILFAQTSIPITIYNDSQRAGTKRNPSWDWSIWVMPRNSADLRKIKYVEYTLHDTFPEPVRRIYSGQAYEDCDQIGGNQYYKMCTNGWGEFTVKVKIGYTNGYYMIYNYRLCLFDCEGDQNSQSYN